MRHRGADPDALYLPRRAGLGSENLRLRQPLPIRQGAHIVARHEDGAGAPGDLD
ncbi:MAG: hypothetical protein QGI11_11625 [Nitrospinota bacterium]|jgi:hypothetical protein|nr:hypothetical protein [Nitrospinota bacterium]MDP7369975.1 hypothetical protein [Nitrospinota bacterium]MDP7502966.1 hypothetical protein [Nitrospinota bacterium]MDP7662822.1 hypothetical protein [Nitrospinota bacterium]